MEIVKFIKRQVLSQPFYS